MVDVDAKRLANLCIYSGCTERVEDSDYCAPHEDHERRRNAAAKARQRARLREAGRCIDCGSKMGIGSDVAKNVHGARSVRCFVCAERVANAAKRWRGTGVGITPVVAPANVHGARRMPIRFSDGVSIVPRPANVHGASSATCASCCEKPGTVLDFIDGRRVLVCAGCAEPEIDVPTREATTRDRLLAVLRRSDGMEIQDLAEACGEDSALGRAKVSAALKRAICAGLVTFTGRKNDRIYSLAPPR